MKADVFGGKIATKMAALEELLKSNNDGKGFLVGDSVRFSQCLMLMNSILLAGYLYFGFLFEFFYKKLGLAPSTKSFLI